MHLPNNTPHHYINQEFNSYSIAESLLNRTFNWWIKLLQMPSHRLPKIAYNRLVHIDSLPSNSPKNNWYSLLKSILQLINREDLIYQHCPAAIAEHKTIAISTYITKLRQEDINRIQDSRYNTNYKTYFQETHYFSIKHLSTSPEQ